MTVNVRRRVWRTADGRLVPEGHVDAAFLAFTPGDAVADAVAVAHGLTADLAGDTGVPLPMGRRFVVPAVGANVDGTTVIPGPGAGTSVPPPVVAAPLDVVTTPVLAPDASVDGAAVVAPATPVIAPPKIRTRKD